jgi:hypothetical protein
MPLASAAMATICGARSSALRGNASSIVTFSAKGRAAQPGAPKYKSCSALSSAAVSGAVPAVISLGRSPPKSPAFVLDRCRWPCQSGGGCAAQPPIYFAQKRVGGWSCLSAATGEGTKRVFVFSAGRCRCSNTAADSDHSAYQNPCEHRRDSTFGVDHGSSEPATYMGNPYVRRVRRASYRGAISAKTCFAACSIQLVTVGP